jgi:predicted SnoaL-like aldol condensation-catalyzing enzyme
MRIAAILGAALAAAPAFAAVPTVEQADKQIIDDFFMAGQAGMSREARAAKFQADGYIQHNPRFLKMDETTGQRGRAAWIAAGPEGQKRGVRLVDQGIPLRNPVILMAEGDLVHAVYRGRILDPARPGESYEAFAFETVRVKGGQFTEHWDGVRLTADWAVQRAAPAAEQPPVAARAEREPRAPCKVTAAETKANKAVVEAYLQRPVPARGPLRAAAYVEHDPRPEGGRPDPRGRVIMSIAECDLVSVVWKLDLPDPTAPGKRYEAFASDTFRLGGGKVSEHWNDLVRGRPPGE